MAAFARTQRAVPPPLLRSSFFHLNAVRRASGTVRNTVPPSVGNFTPAIGSQVTSTTAIQFDVTDARSILRVLVMATSPFGGIEVVFDGVAFTNAYSASSRSVIANGFHFIVSRSGGWTIPPQLTVYCTDIDGNEA